jgi:hypothetical protein
MALSADRLLIPRIQFLQQINGTVMRSRDVSRPSRQKLAQSEPFYSALDWECKFERPTPSNAATIPTALIGRIMEKPVRTDG